jgi:NADP-dependent 3-hydroxy acid dehydrogenase YdfG
MSELNGQGPSDAADDDALKNWFENLSTPIDHVMVTAGGPWYAPLLEMGSDQVREVLSGHVTLYLAVARHSVSEMTPRGSLIFMGGTGGRTAQRSTRCA